MTETSGPRQCGPHFLKGKNVIHKIIAGKARKQARTYARWLLRRKTGIVWRAGIPVATRNAVAHHVLVHYRIAKRRIAAEMQI